MRCWFSDPSGSPAASAIPFNVINNHTTLPHENEVLSWPHQKKNCGVKRKWSQRRLGFFFIDWSQLWEKNSREKIAKKQTYKKAASPLSSPFHSWMPSLSSFLGASFTPTPPPQKTFFCPPILFSQLWANEPKIFVLLTDPERKRKKNGWLFFSPPPFPVSSAPKQGSSSFWQNKLTLVKSC